MDDSRGKEKENRTKKIKTILSDINLKSAVWIYFAFTSTNFLNNLKHISR